MSPYPLTNPTIFLRLKQSDAAPREMAWAEFYARYAPVITAFARRMNVPRSDVEDIVQDVLTGFFAKSPTFVYDPAKGRFRGYLKVCTYRALCHRSNRERRFKGQPLHEVDPEEVAIEQVWSEAWDENRVRLALEQLRATIGHTRTFAAFEQYVLLEQPAATVATKLGLHINSVYRAREQVGRALQEKLNSLPEDE